MKPVVYEATEELMRFLSPVFKILEKIYKKFAPTLYKTTKARIQKFMNRI
jgi:hypothetical protein